MQRGPDESDRLLVEAAERKMAENWKDGNTVSLPLPPPGLQWSLGAEAGREEEAERAVKLTASFKSVGGWSFSIGGKAVLPFDARAVVSPCTLDTANHTPMPLNESRSAALRTALYVHGAEGLPPPGGAPALAALSELHSFAADARRHGAREGQVYSGHSRRWRRRALRQDGSARTAYGRWPIPGRCERLPLAPTTFLIWQVYDWLPLAAAGAVTARTWRDMLLALKTREAEHVTLGPVHADGSGSARDMSEGVILRLFYALEMLYPTALAKEGALRWRVRPRGAGYYHMLHCLDQLGRGAVPPPPAAPPPLATAPAALGAADLRSPTCAGGAKGTEASPHTATAAAGKRPRRPAAAAGSKAAAAMATAEAGGGDGSEPAYIAAEPAAEGEAAEEEYLPLPTVGTQLWAHQKASVERVVAGVREGRRGHADASAVGAGKTLSALATVARLAAHLEATGVKRNGVLIMLPTKALIKEWLIEV